MIEYDLRAAMGDLRGLSAADRLCQGCVELVGVSAAAISVVSQGVNVGTLGSSGTAVRTYDEAQFTHGEGPSLDAVAQCSPVLVADLADPGEVRWPGYRPAMLTHRIRGVFAIPIEVAGYCVGALSVFQTCPGELTTAQMTAVVAAAKLAQMPVLEVIDQQQQPETDGDAWPRSDTWTRPEVSQATGMVMIQLRLKAPDALARLRAHAYATGRSATDVARDILERRLYLNAD